MDNDKLNDFVWVTVYRDIVEPGYDQITGEYDLPCVELLIPRETLLAWLKEKNLSWDWYVNESLTEDFDDLYKFARDHVIAKKYTL